MDELAERLLEYENDSLPDESTVRKKLAEYISLGLIKKVKHENEKSICYMLMNDNIDLAAWKDAIEFFSEASPLGVVGSFVNDRLDEHHGVFHFKHHYILDALESEILYSQISQAGCENHSVEALYRNSDSKIISARIFRQILFLQA